MPTVSRTVLSPAPLEKVWEYLTDFTTVTQWDPNTPHCRRVEGEGEIGTVYAVTSVFRKRETHLEYTVRTLTPQEKFVVEGENNTVTAVEDMTFRATDDGGTEVEYRADFTFHGPSKLAVPFLGGALNQIADDAEAGMRKALDAL